MNKDKYQNKNSNLRISRSMTLSHDKKPKTQNFIQDLSRVANQQISINQKSNPKLIKNFSVSSIGTAGIENKIQKENSKRNFNIDSHNNIMMSKKLIKTPSDNKQQLIQINQNVLPPNKNKISFPSKRKNTLNEYKSISIIEKSKLTTIKNKIEEMFKKYSNQESQKVVKFEKSVFNSGNQNLNNLTNWKKNFRETFEKEKIIDFSSSDFLPKSLNNMGSYVLKLEKFWVLWLEVIKKELNLDKMINLFNYALSFMNDDKVLKKHFNFLLTDLKISKTEITDFCKVNNITNKINSIHVGQYDFLLDPSCCYNLKNNTSTISEIPVSSKTKKSSPFFGTGYDGGKLQNSEILIRSSSSSKINKILNQSDFSKIDFKENQESALKNNDISIIERSDNKAFSFYDLIQSQSPLPINENCNIQNEVSIPLINPKYEASYLTINETVNEETINFVNNKTHQDYTTPSSNSINENKFMDQQSFLIRSPEVSNSSKSYLFYQNVNKSCDSYTEKLRVLTQQGNLDTKSIVNDIENITTTLKKEIDQLRSPNTFQENISDKDILKSCCKSSCCVVHTVFQYQQKSESKNSNICDIIPGHENLRLHPNLVFEKISSQAQEKKINSINMEMEISVDKQTNILENKEEDCKQIIIQNHNDSVAIFNDGLAEELEKEKNYTINNIESDFSREKNTDLINVTILNSPNNQSPQDEPRVIEDSYEKFLKETATKRGEDINDYISYKNFTPKTSLIENAYSNDEPLVSNNLNEKEQYFTDKSNRNGESNGKENSSQNISLCLYDKKEDEEIQEIIGKRRRKTYTGVKKRGKAKSKSKSRSKSIKKSKNK